MFSPVRPWTWTFAAAVLLLGSAAGATPRLVATVQFEVGSAELTSDDMAMLDGIKSQYPPDRWNYSFEGDHDPSPYDIVTPNASLRINERLGETRWQNIARYLGVPAIGLIRVTGDTVARVYVEERSETSGGPGLGASAPQSVADSLAALRRELDALRREQAEAAAAARRTAPAETILAVARFEELHVRLDKWLEERWWENMGGIELGILRVQPESPEKHSGATLIVGNGTPAYHPFEISTRFDFVRVGVPRIGITPALRWYDWSIRVHYGDDPLTRVSFVSNGDPVYLLGADLDAVPWRGSLVRLKYAGLGTRVHADHRPFSSYDQYDLRFDQNLWPHWRLEGQAVYDERFEKSLCYYGGWFAHGWRMLLGEFVIHMGFVRQLDAFAATRLRRENWVNTVSLGFSWERTRRLR
jgi:hypothetical protein